MLFSAQELRVEPVVSWQRKNFSFLQTHSGRATFLLLCALRSLTPPRCWPATAPLSRTPCPSPSPRPCVGCGLRSRACKRMAVALG
jgi:hypothetical protein